MLPVPAVFLWDYVLVLPSLMWSLSKGEGSSFTELYCPGASFFAAAFWGEGKNLSATGAKGLEIDSFASAWNLVTEETMWCL